MTEFLIKKEIQIKVTVILFELLFTKFTQLHSILLEASIAHISSLRFPSGALVKTSWIFPLQ